MWDQALIGLADYGGLGLFALFLIWQYVEQKKQLKEMMKGFQDKLDELRKQSDDRESNLRQRYDDVVNRIQSERDELRTALLSQVGDLERNVHEIDRKMDTLSLLVTDLREKILKLEIKDMTLKGQ